MVANRDRALLTNLELSVMLGVWVAHPQPVTAREVVDQLNAERRKPLAYNTVQTVLTILREKGVVAVRPGPGRAHVYRAKLSRDEVRGSMVDDLVERLYEGELSPLLLNLVESEALSRAELERVRRVIDQRLDDDVEDPP